MPGPLDVGAVLALGLVGDLAGAGAKLVKAKLALGKGALRARLVATQGVLDTKIHHLDSRYDQLKEPIWLPTERYLFQPRITSVHPRRIFGPARRIPISRTTIGCPVECSKKQ